MESRSTTFDYYLYDLIYFQFQLRFYEKFLFFVRHSYYEEISKWKKKRTNDKENIMLLCDAIPHITQYATFVRLVIILNQTKIYQI